jgi:peptide/nickel transport system permease protein
MTRRPSDLILFIGKRMVQLVPVLIGIIVLTFFVSRIEIADPCGAWLGAHASKTALQGCVSYFGLRLPLYVQFERYLVTLLSGSWGIDPIGDQPILPLLLQAFPETLELVLAAVLIMVVIGIPLGVVAASAPGRWPDHVVRLFYLTGWSTPTYLVGAVLALGLGPALGVSPGAYTSIPTYPTPTHMSMLDALLAGNLPATWDTFVHLLFPATALAFLNLGLVTRMTRTSMLETLPMEYIRAAQMKGLGEFVVLFKHALRNSLITTSTVIGLTIGYLLGGTIVIEELFQWPGIGAYAYNVMTTYDFAGTIGFVVFVAIGVVLANLLADVLYGVLDPRVEWR